MWHDVLPCSLKKPFWRVIDVMCRKLGPCESVLLIILLADNHLPLAYRLEASTGKSKSPLKQTCFDLFLTSLLTTPLMFFSLPCMLQD
jgi:hypothetical protein